MSEKIKDLQSIIQILKDFWVKNGCVEILPYTESSIGAGTFHPVTALYALRPKNEGFCYVQPSTRPTDGRYGESPNRLQQFLQFQAIIKPAPSNIKDIYLESLQALGVSYKEHDIRFVEDDWESPTLGAFGLGWEVWCDGMEITQFTYFQKVGGIDVDVVPVEITYGIERLAMYITGCDNVYDLYWSLDQKIKYRDLFLESEVQYSKYNFEHANIDFLLLQFKNCIQECKDLVQNNLPLPAYQQLTKATHAFNVLDARGYLGVNNRMLYIQTIQEMAHKCCSLVIKEQE